MKSFKQYISECDCGCNSCGDTLEEAEYQGRKVTLNKPFRTPDGPKKFAVYTKNESGTVVIVRFGDPDMEIKRDDPERRANFRSRHNCDDPGPKWKARYWSCYQWRAGAEVAEDTVNETIVKRDGKWLVMNKAKTKVLGTHDTEKKAKAQLAAIEISKHGG